MNCIFCENELDCEKTKINLYPNGRDYVREYYRCLGCIIPDSLYHNNPGKPFSKHTIISDYDGTREYIRIPFDMNSIYLIIKNPDDDSCKLMIQTINPAGGFMNLKDVIEDIDIDGWNFADEAKIKNKCRTMVVFS